jgi:hypothetical protein
MVADRGKTRRFRGANNKIVKREQPLCLEFQYIQMYQMGFSNHRRTGC